MNMTVAQYRKISHKQTLRPQQPRSIPNYMVFYRSLKALGIEIPIQECRFHKTRRWRFDFCFVKARLALEIEGGVWTNGRHTRGSGFVRDMEKYNAAAILGYRLLRVTPEQMQNGQAIGLIAEYFNRVRNEKMDCEN